MALAVTRLARLIKGYSDTHSKGMSLFMRLSAIGQGLADRPDGAAQLDSLLQAAMADASGKELDLAIKKIPELATEPAARDAA